MALVKIIVLEGFQLYSIQYYMYMCVLICLRVLRLFFFVGKD